jgi:hypothetical protein
MNISTTAAALRRVLEKARSQMWCGRDRYPVVSNPVDPTCIGSTLRRGAVTARGMPRAPTARPTSARGAASRRHGLRSPAGPK